MINIFEQIKQLFNGKKPEPKLNYRSGYFSPDGMFYGCSELGHLDLADKLIRMNPSYPNKLDTQRILELEGWIKISNNELFYFNFNKRPTQAQIDAIFDHFKDPSFKFNFRSMRVKDLITYIEKNYNGITPDE